MKRILLLQALLLSFAAQVHAAGPYNVLLISIDTLRADHLGCYGSAAATPAIDAFAAQSVVFENVIAQTPLTLPSHGTIFTGLFPDRHGIRNNESFILRPTFITLAELFQQNGYSTGGVVGSFSLDSRFGIDQGFDFYDDEIAESHDPYIVRHSERRAETVWQLGRRWIESQKRPWFAFLHFFDPHTGYNPPRPFPQTYRGEVRYTDSVTGKIFEFLEQHNLRSTTIVVLLSDHGESLGEHGESSHGVFLYDATLKVPLIMRVPGWKPARYASQVRLVDVAPTIVSVAGLRNTPQFDGVNLMTDGAFTPSGSPAYSETYYTNLLMGWAPLFAIRGGGKKYIAAPKPEFYDLQKDPGETKNIYSPSALPLSFQREFEKHRKTDQSAGQAASVDSETREKLASLGYVTGSTAVVLGGSGVDPKDGIAAWDLIEHAVTLAQLGKLNQAEQKLGEALKQQPANVIALKFIAAVERKLKKNAESIKHLQAALESPLHRNETRLELAELHIEQRDFGRALEFSEAVLKEEPANKRALKLSGLSFAGSKKFDEAINRFQRACNTDCTDPQVLSEYARLLSYKGRDAEALKMYSSLETLRTLNEPEAIQMAALFLTERQIAEAERYFRIALDANPKSSPAWKGIGLIAASKGDWETAVRAFFEAGECAEAKKILLRSELPEQYRMEYATRCNGN